MIDNPQIPLQALLFKNNVDWISFKLAEIKTARRERKIQMTSELYTFLILNIQWVKSNPKFYNGCITKLYELIEDEGWEGGIIFTNSFIRNRTV